MNPPPNTEALMLELRTTRERINAVCSRIYESLPPEAAELFEELETLTARERTLQSLVLREAIND